MGDLTYIKPTATFQGFQSMKRLNIPLVLEYWSVQETDNMPVSTHAVLYSFFKFYLCMPNADVAFVFYCHTEMVCGR
jgi:hypothetical protein